MAAELQPRLLFKLLLTLPSTRWWHKRPCKTFKCTASDLGPAGLTFLCSSSSVTHWSGESVSYCIQTQTSALHNSTCRSRRWSCCSCLQGFLPGSLSCFLVGWWWASSLGYHTQVCDTRTDQQQEKVHKKTEEDGVLVFYYGDKKVSSLLLHLKTFIQCFTVHHLLSQAIN